MSMRNQTKLKYTACIKDCYAMKEFIQDDMRAKYQLDNNLFVAMHQCNVITAKDGITRWTDVVLTDQILNNILSVYSKHRVSKNSQRRFKRKALKEMNQLIIAPIRKAPAPTVLPVSKEPEYDNSNSKMLLILAAGAIVGFMIATLIWK